MEAVDRQHPRRVAFVRGPVALVYDDWAIEELPRFPEQGESEKSRPGFAASNPLTRTVDLQAVSAGRILRSPGSTCRTPWYRIPVPAPSAAVTLPRSKKPVRVFYEGARIPPDSSGQVRFPAAGPGHVLAVLIAADDEIRANPVFALAETPVRLLSGAPRRAAVR
jgi:hypothetical protein